VQRELEHRAAVGGVRVVVSTPAAAYRQTPARRTACSLWAMIFCSAAATPALSPWRTRSARPRAQAAHPGKQRQALCGYSGREPILRSSLAPLAARSRRRCRRRTRRVLQALPSGIVCVLETLERQVRRTRSRECRLIAVDACQPDGCLGFDVPALGASGAR
jgi:hypothetical protein